MQAILQARNNQLLLDVSELIEMISTANVPDELIPFKLAVEQMCLTTRAIVRKNLSRLASPKRSQILLKEIISDTSHRTQIVRQMSEILAPALVRDPYGTHLSLKIVSWLHQEHPQTRPYFPVVTDGSWSILPFFLPIYYVPILQQRRLLQQALLFHEFGHLLYRHHKEELDALVKEFQFTLLRKFIPTLGTNDGYFRDQLAYNQDVATTWYKWLQELFCDAVGFQIGGPSYLRAFSAALESVSKEDFFIAQEDLIGSSHPVSWLRVQFLTKRAKKANFTELADEISSTWNEVAKTLAIKEDYFGLYDEILEEAVIQTLEDMLLETAPRHYLDTEVNSGETNNLLSPVALLNKAWQISAQEPKNYLEWEKSAIDSYLKVLQTA